MMRLSFLLIFLAWMAGCVWVDLRTRRIPWPLSYGGLLLGGWGAMLFPHTAEDWVLTAAFWLVPFVFWFKKREGFGGADVRFLWAIALVSPSAAVWGVLVLGAYVLWTVLRRIGIEALPVYLRNLQKASPDEIGGRLIPMTPAVASGAAIYLVWTFLAGSL